MNRFLIPLLSFVLGSASPVLAQTPNCCNILTNGDFEQGNAGFTSDLVQICSCVGSSYCVNTNFKTKCSGWQNLNDHTSGAGNFLIVDGAESSPIPVNVWRINTTIVSGANYCFSFWVASQYGSPFDLGLAVNGTLVPGAVFSVLQGGASWTQYTFSWTATSPGNNISIQQLLAGDFQDFGIDDIVFGQQLEAKFVSTPNISCGMNVQFFSQSTGPAPLTYSWNFGDPGSPGNISTLQNPVHNFSQCKDFEVCLTIHRGTCVDTYCETISVTDDEPPAITCPANLSVSTSPPACTTVVNGIKWLTATDNCGTPSVTYSINGGPTGQNDASGQAFSNGTSTVAYTATDKCENIKTCAFQVTVICKITCDPTCPGNLVTNPGFENGQAGAPNAANQIGLCTDWHPSNNNPSVNSIGDWYSISNPNFPGFFNDVPNQQNTRLLPHCGSKYAGFDLNTCEGISTMLTMPIPQGCPYEVGFWWTPREPVTVPFTFFAILSGANCTVNAPPGTCSHQCGGDQHVIVNVTPSNVPGTWYFHSMTLNNAYPNVQNITFAAAQSQPRVDNYIFVDDVCVSKVVEPCSVTAGLECFPAINPTSYTSLATLGCGSTVTQVDWYFDGVGPNPSSTNLVSVVHPFSTLGIHKVCLVVTATNGEESCRDTFCKNVAIIRVPPTKCDSVGIFLNEIIYIQEGPCCYQLFMDNMVPNYFSQIDLTLSSGTFANSVLTDGTFTVSGGGNHVILTPVSGFIPTGTISPFKICDPGGTNPHTLDVNLLSGPPANDTCHTSFEFSCISTPPPDSCCANYDAFCQNVVNSVNILVNNEQCKANFLVGSLPGCDYIKDLDYGDGTQVAGPLVAGDISMHTYQHGGTYFLSWLAVEVNPHTGEICFEKTIKDTITLVCEACSCDAIALTVQPISNNMDVCCYRLIVQNDNAACFEDIKIQVDAGLVILNPVVTASGWTVVPNGTQGVILTPPAGQNVPAGTILPLTFCVAGGTVHDIAVFTGYNTPTESYECDKFFKFDCAAVGICPNNLVQNGSFEMGTPNGSDESIGLATGWSGIWPQAPGVSTGDLYNTVFATPTMAFSSLLTPMPASQGNFGAFWSKPHATDPIWREGIMNTLAAPILPNTGCYELSAKLACLTSPIIPYPGAVLPEIAVYGVPTIAPAGVHPGTTGLNTSIFNPAPILLGTFKPSATCDKNFMQFSFTFDVGPGVGGLQIPALGINRIFFTRMDGVNSSVVMAIDDVCLAPTACPPNEEKNCGWAVATYYGISPTSDVGVIYDTRFNSQAPLGNDWGTAAPPVTAIHPLAWKMGMIGTVFGIALDNQDKIFLAASDVYRQDAGGVAFTPSYGPGGPAGVYVTDFFPPYNTTAIMGSVNSPTLANIVGTGLPNMGGIGNGIGNIAYDHAHGQLFLTDLEDGRIYRIDPAGNLKSAYDPFQPASNNAGIETPAERIWGIGIYNNRVYFAREQSGSNPKQIWSVGLDASGEFIGTTVGTTHLFTGNEQLEISPGPGAQKKYTDIAFCQSTGKMLFAERGDPHNAQVFEYHKVGPVWAPSGNNFSVGDYSNTGKNSAGGVDYGYQELNGNPKAVCNGLVWASGNCMDPVAIPGAWRQVYGLEGILASGNTNLTNTSTDIYIDYDGAINVNPKQQLGDVEVFKCGCPPLPVTCDSISITSMPSDGPQDTCCFKLTVDIKKPNYFTAIQLCASNGVSLSSVSVLNGCVLNSYDATQATVVPAGGIPNLFSSGTKDFIKFCVSNYETVQNQTVIVKYYGPNYTVVCMDTLHFNCTQKPKCLKVTTDVVCAPDGTYKMNFCVMANALIGFNVSTVVLNPQNGVIFTPNVFHLTTPLGPNQMQCNFMTTVSGNVVDGQMINFSVTAHALNAAPPIDCCTDTVTLAKATMPTCICNKVSASTMSVNMPPDKCCWKVTLNNNYPTPLFKEIQLDILTLGVVFGAITNPFPPAWTMTSNPTHASFKKFPTAFLGASETLPTFCLSGITGPAQVPQKVALKWIDMNGKVICIDTLVFNCPPPDTTDCAVLVDPKIECDPNALGSYIMTFKVKNNSAFPVHQVSLNAVAPYNLAIPSTPITIPQLNPGFTSGLISVPISAVPSGDQLCFYLTIHQIGANGNELNCCTHSKQYCFTMPSCCCTDSTTFDNLVAQGFKVVKNGCSITVTAPQFGPCYLFGTPPYVDGGDVIQVITDPSGSWTYSFTQSGTHQICVGVFDDCNFKKMCTTVTVDCGNCTCGTFSDLCVTIGYSLPAIHVACNTGTTYSLGCPPYGYSHKFGGKFQCNGSDCPTVNPVHWTLSGPAGNFSGNTSANPYFAINLLPTYFLKTGIYTLTVDGSCNGIQCPSCVMHFSVDCAGLCPCDQAEFQANLNQGFSIVQNGCQVCFSPKDLTDCDMVEWWINGLPIGTAVGTQTFCTNINGSGIYNITMDVTRTKTDGTVCALGSRQKTVSLTCSPANTCSGDVFSNPTFSQSPVQAGGLAQGGAGKTPGWTAAAGKGNPVVVEGAPGSNDGWTIKLSGNLDTADVLTRFNVQCLEKMTGTVTLRFRKSAPGPNVPVDKELTRLIVGLYRGDNFSYVCCELDTLHYNLAAIDLSEFDSDNWYEVSIPYDLSNWAIHDVCGDAPHGALVRPAVYVTNWFGNIQGGTATYSEILLDNLCFDGKLVGIETPLLSNRCRIFPNPNPGMFSVELPSAATLGMAFRIVGLTGQTLREQPAQAGLTMQTVQAGDLPPGLYFLQVVSEGKVLAVEKFVKQ